MIRVSDSARVRSARLVTALGAAALLVLCSKAANSETQLATGQMTAIVQPALSDKVLPAGGSAFVEIVLTNVAAAKPIDAELVLYAHGGKVRAVSGPNLKVRDEAQTRVARIGRLAKNKPVKLTVELQLSQLPPAKGEAKLWLDGLTINLRQPPSLAGDSTTLSWKVADCAGGYHHALTALGEQYLQGLKEAVAASRVSDKKLPGKWTFAPQASQQRTRPAGSADQDAPTPAQVFSYANALVGSRGLDAQLKLEQRPGWIAQRVAADLRTYLTQANNPALCTGAQQFVGHYRKSMGEFTARAQHVEKLSIAARQLAEERVTALAEELAAARVASVAEHGTGAGSARDLKQLVQEIAVLTGAEGFGREAGSSDLLAALSLMRRGLNDAEELSKEAKQAAQPALSAVEAAFYIDAASKRYERVQGLIESILDGIGKAHAIHCTCGT